jgi:hypothetical protein
MSYVLDTPCFDLTRRSSAGATFVEPVPAAIPKYMTREEAIRVLRAMPRESIPDLFEIYKNLKTQQDVDHALAGAGFTLQQYNAVSAILGRPPLTSSGCF